MLTGDGRTLTYTANNLLATAVKSNQEVEYYYGPDNQRFKRVDRDPSDNETTTFYSSSTEWIVHEDNSKEWKRSILGYAQITHEFNSGNSETSQSLHYLLKDHLGSITHIVDDATYGTLVASQEFDPWGNRRKAEDWTQVLPTINIQSWFREAGPITGRGYTGHESMDEMGLIHMNGRVYDPKLGRMIQADPLIQAPYFSQSLNRYSYVWNNPARYVDPSGYCTVLYYVHETQVKFEGMNGWLTEYQAWSKYSRLMAEGNYEMRTLSTPVYSTGGGGGGGNRRNNFYQPMPVWEWVSNFAANGGQVNTYYFGSGCSFGECSPDRYGVMTPNPRSNSTATMANIGGITVPVIKIGALPDGSGSVNAPSTTTYEFKTNETIINTQPPVAPPWMGVPIESNYHSQARSMPELLWRNGINPAATSLAMSSANFNIGSRVITAEEGLRQGMLIAQIEGINNFTNAAMIPTRIAFDIATFGSLQALYGTVRAVQYYGTISTSLAGYKFATDPTLMNGVSLGVNIYTGGLVRGAGYTMDAFLINEVTNRVVDQIPDK